MLIIDQKNKCDQEMNLKIRKYFLLSICKGRVQEIQLRANSSNIQTKALQWGQFNCSDPQYLGMIGYVLFCRQNCILKNIQDILTSPPNLINEVYRIFVSMEGFRFFSMILYKYCLVHYFQFRIKDGSSSNEKLLKKLMILTLLRLT